MHTLTKCLFPVAGYGTRFLPFTKSMPKEMLPIINKPLIHYGVEEAVVAGLNELCFITSRNKRAIDDYFDVHYELEQQVAGRDQARHLQDIQDIMDNTCISFVRQRHILGLGNAILCGKTLIGDNCPFGVVLADDLCFNEGKNVMQQLMDLYNQYQCSVVAVQELSPEYIPNFGIVTGETIADGTIRVSDMVEKPSLDQAPSNLGIVGRYILTPDIFTLLENISSGVNNEIQITDALRQQAMHGQVIACVFKGLRFDCGSTKDYIAAINYCYQKHSGHQN